MAKKINIKGVIVSDSDYWVYEYLDIAAVSPKMIHRQLEDANGKPVEVEINSGGGDVFAGSEIYSALKAYSMNGGYVTVNIVGLAASAASVVAMAGDQVLMSPTSQLMIHNAWIGGASGDHRDMDHMSGVLKNVNQTLANAYRIKTGKTEAELLTMLDDETWLTPEQALLHRFIDGILFEDNTMQRSNLKTFPSAKSTTTGKAAATSSNKIAAQSQLSKLQQYQMEYEKLELLKLKGMVL
ncbi:head maturation protease, ClpP-related [Bacillaceae bacterium C204]|uniref:head maturation protease, ClpP-related n=1 Tax=Neobacillus sp. 204 TaxID=3383351 RepID=UPI00397BDCCA